MPSTLRHPNHARRLIPAAALLLVAMLLIEMAAPAARSQAAAPLPKENAPEFIFFKRLKPEICANTYARASFAVAGTGGQIIPGAAANASANRGRPSVEFNSFTGEGELTYLAPAEPGPDNVSLTAGNGQQAAIHTFEVTVIPCDYKLTILAIQIYKNEVFQGTRMLEGEGYFRMREGVPEGEGSLTYSIKMTGGSIYFGCRFDPPINVNQPFKIRNASPWATPLINSVISLSLDTRSFTIPKTSMKCNAYHPDSQVKVTPIPMAFESFDVSDAFKDMSFPAEGGEWPFRYKYGSGIVYVYRIRSNQ